MKDRERRQIVGTQILPTRHTKLDQRRTEISPREQQLHQQNRIRVRKRGPILSRLANAAIDGKRIATRREREHHEKVNGDHLVVIEVSEATQQSLIKGDQQQRSLGRDNGEKSGGAQ